MLCEADFFNYSLIILIENLNAVEKIKNFFSNQKIKI